MDPDGKVIELVPRDPQYDGVLCACGSAWFDAVVALQAGGRVGSRRLPSTCHECGEPAPA